MLFGFSMTVVVLTLITTVVTFEMNKKNFRQSYVVFTIIHTYVYSCLDLLNWQFAQFAIEMLVKLKIVLPTFRGSFAQIVCHQFQKF